MSDLRSAVEALRRAVVMDWGPTVESAVAIIDAHQCLPSRGRIRIRTPDDKPGHWTAQGDLVPGVPYTYSSGDVAVTVDWKGAHQCLPSEEDLAALITESTTKLLNDRATIGYHDDIRPYIRLRNYLLANLRERRG